MANVISDETMEYVGILAKLELKDEEKESARQDMQKMLDYVDKLNELDTSKVEPMTHIFEMGNVFREDEGRISRRHRRRLQGFAAGKQNIRRILKKSG